MRTTRKTAAAVLAKPQTESGHKPIQVTITKVGTSAGIILPKSVLQHLHAEKGQKLFVTEAPDGSVLLTKHDADFEDDMKYAYEAMDRFPDAFKELAK